MFRPHRPCEDPAMRLIASALVPALLGACESAAEVQPPPPLAGVPTTVVLLDPHFVRFEGARIPLDAFLLEMRERVRAAGGEPDRLPLVTVTSASTEEELGGLVGRVVEELRRAGIRSIQLGDV